MVSDVRPIPWYNWDTMAAAGGIISSSNDMANWLRVQLARGKIDDSHRLFSEASSRKMWTPQTTIPLSESYQKRYPSTHFRAYGLGWSLSDYQGRKIVGHGGGYDGMNSHVLLVPEEKLGVVVLTNSLTPISNLLAYRAVDTLLGTIAKDVSQENLAEFKKSRDEFQARIDKVTTPVAEGTKPSHPLADYAGKFRCPIPRHINHGMVFIPGDCRPLGVVSYRPRCC